MSVSENEKIGVPLAHHLPDWEAERLGASEIRDYAPGETVTLPRSGARMLLAAGLLQCNPRDQDTVDQVLQLPARSTSAGTVLPKPHHPAPHATGTEAAAKGSQAADDETAGD